MFRSLHCHHSCLQGEGGKERDTPIDRPVSLWATCYYRPQGTRIEARLTGLPFRMICDLSEGVILRGVQYHGREEEYTISREIFCYVYYLL